jgi:uncharacterized membrane protein
MREVCGDINMVIATISLVSIVLYYLPWMLLALGVNAFSRSNPITILSLLAMGWWAFSWLLFLVFFALLIIDLFREKPINKNRISAIIAIILLNVAVFIGLINGIAHTA